MWEGFREHVLEKHDAFVEAMKERVFPIFRDIDSEAEGFADKKYNELMSMPYWDENVDASSIADMAQDLAIAKYESLAFLKHEMLLGALAGLYHLWERMLRDFLEHEFKHWMKRELSEELAWKKSINQTLAMLGSFGWDPRKQPFFGEIDACRLIVNVYKHGKGDAVKTLAATYPRYVGHPLGLDMKDGFGLELLDHDHLKVTEVDILRIASNLRQFWETFPERLFPAVAPASRP